SLAQDRLEHDISRTLIDLRVMREFQRTMFESISEESQSAGQSVSRYRKPNTSASYIGASFATDIIWGLDSCGDSLKSDWTGKSLPALSTNGCDLNGEAYRLVDSLNAFCPCLRRFREGGWP